MPIPAGLARGKVGKGRNKNAIISNRSIHAALFVDPSNRRHGFGRLLVDHCAQVARENGSTDLHVIGNPHAEEFYRECGFTIIGMVETRFGVGLLMKKQL